MPLLKGKSDETVSKNISEMVHTGHPRLQAIAASMRMAGRPKPKRGTSGRSSKRQSSRPSSR